MEQVVLIPSSPDHDRTPSSGYRFSVYPTVFVLYSYARESVVSSPTTECVAVNHFSAVHGCTVIPCRLIVPTRICDSFNGLALAA